MRLHGPLDVRPIRFWETRGDAISAAILAFILKRLASDLVVISHPALRSSSPATGVIWALRAQSPKKVRKWAPGAERPRGSKKCRKRVEKSPKSRKIVNFGLFFDSFPTFSTRPGNPFSDFFWTLGPKGPNDPCSRRRRSQTLQGKRQQLNFQQPLYALILEHRNCLR